MPGSRTRVKKGVPDEAEARLSGALYPGHPASLLPAPPVPAGEWPRSVVVLPAALRESHRRLLRVGRDRLLGRLVGVRRLRGAAVGRRVSVGRGLGVRPGGGAG